jgi:hypothetical protein
MAAIAWPGDRARLLAHGEMCSPVYSSRDAREVAAGSYRSMSEAAGLLGLGLTEPIYEFEAPDRSGGRVVRVRAGVFDLLASA